ncbi:MAG: hypothetical protein RBR08_13800 [Desulforegulaceae bacterium]|nr:hypothetical protein [Desulforegulaceae bacterium]
MKIKVLNILIIFLLFFIIPDISFSLEALSKEKMKTTTGQRALTDISTSGDTTRLFLNTHIETFTEIESLKLAYFDRDGNGEKGWDQNWNNLKLGSEHANLTIDGLVIKADFVNLASSEPVLKRFIIGSNMLNGTISGNFDSFTGTYNPKLLGPDSAEPAQEYLRHDLGEKKFTFKTSEDGTNQGFFLILSPEAAHNGIHAVLGFSEGNAPNITDVSPWWNAP